MNHCEEWLDHFANIIPFSESYTMKLEASEENGLLVCLEDNRFVVYIDFGVVYAVNVCDEGVLLNHRFYDNGSEINLFDKKSTLYTIINGEYANMVIDALGSDLYDFYGLKQYNVITMNYLVSVIAKEFPTIHVEEK